MQFFGFLLIAGLSVNIFGAKLPYYMKRCDLKDRKLNQCLKNHANQAIPTLVRGDASVGIPRLSPVITSKIRLNGDRFNLTLTDVIFDNFKDMLMTEANLDLRKSKYNFDITCHYLTFSSSYILTDGRTLTRTLFGNGGFEMRLVDNVIKYSADIIAYKKGGENYLRSTNAALKLEYKRMVFRFKKLWSTNNGNEDIHAFLQENWKIIHNEIKPGVEKFLKSRISSVLTAIEDNVVVEDIFINPDVFIN